MDCSLSVAASRARGYTLLVLTLSSIQPFPYFRPDLNRHMFTAWVWCSLNTVSDALHLTFAQAPRPSSSWRKLSRLCRSLAINGKDGMNNPDARKFDSDLGAGAPVQQHRAEAVTLVQVSCHERRRWHKQPGCLEL